SLCICDFWATLSMDTMAELMTLVTGKEWTADDMAEVGTRVINIARAFNQREGFTAKDDTAPKRIFNDALKNGPAAGQKIPEEAFEDMKQQYYAVMGWNADGTLPDSLIATL
ncbi:MAG: aldehyde ferredoxin oxidoreductase C-terminal domain-containing protein, partial [Anaerovoracaceae bacterium]